MATYHHIPAARNNTNENGKIYISTADNILWQKALMSMLIKFWSWSQESTQRYINAALFLDSTTSFLVPKNLIAYDKLALRNVDVCILVITINFNALRNKRNRPSCNYYVPSCDLCISKLHLVCALRNIATAIFIGIKICKFPL